MIQHDHNLFHAAIDVDFVSGVLSGTEGDTISTCVVITRGGNQLAENVNVFVSHSDVSTSGK